MMGKYWSILTKLRMPFYQRVDMALHHLWHDITGRHSFSSGFYAIDWWSYYKFVKGEEPPDHCYMDDPAWNPEERARLLTFRSSASTAREEE